MLPADGPFSLNPNPFKLFCSLQMGQGCNSALEDSRLLNECVAAAGDDVDAALASYEAMRKPQVGF